MRKSEMMWWGVIAAIFAGGVYGFHYHSKLTKGFCSAEGRYFEKSEFIDIAIAKMLSEREKQIAANESATKADDKYPWVDYSDVEDFKAKNIDCCRVALVTPNSVKIAPHEIRENSRLFGRKYFVVEMVYLDRKAHPNRKTWLVDACGSTEPKLKNGYDKFDGRARIRSKHSHYFKKNIATEQ